MIEEYYSKPNLVPPFSLFVYVTWLFWKLQHLTCKKDNKVSPTDNKIRKQNLISNWTKRINFHAKHFIFCL